MPVPQIHVPFSEVACSEMEVLGIDRHEFGQQHTFHKLFNIIKVIAIHENACKKRFISDDEVSLQFTNKDKIEWKYLFWMHVHAYPCIETVQTWWDREMV